MLFRTCDRIANRRRRFRRGETSGALREHHARLLLKAHFEDAIRILRRVVAAGKPVSLAVRVFIGRSVSSTTVWAGFCRGREKAAALCATYPPPSRVERDLELLKEARQRYRTRRLAQRNAARLTPP
jgi:hypothetical protein